ncbi:hypothetical protein M9H77_28682 [Catharanthus roseus]|uniref:Uncharacterized protein n=1 Tax=Catharanthus roseus TaxID=4058 RepID=A0ACC0AGE5_CATRO|nr:hypothetical protein M9H77_28682 [Catharanthus roseus]
MAKLFHPSTITISLFLLLALCLGFANSARILDQLNNPQNPFPESPEPTTVVAAPVVAPASFPSGQIPATTLTSPADDVVNNVPPVAADDSAPPVVPPVATSASPLPPLADDSAPPVATSAAPVANVAPVTTADHPTLSFYMHDILGGSHPSGRVVTGVVANTDANGLPFSKPNNQIFPINGGVPLNTINGVINNNNYPFLVGLNGSPSNTILSNNGGNNVVAGNNNQPFVTAGQLPAGLTLQQLMFGSVTVVDNEITEGHELGTAIIGRAQGFYLASSLDGSSHTLALTAIFHNHHHEGGEGSIEEIVDSVSFFGVHRTANPISHLAIIGGTGKYENGKGYATIETDLKHEDQHTTDGVETITHFTLYLTP